MKSAFCDKASVSAELLSSEFVGEVCAAYDYESQRKMPKKRSCFNTHSSMAAKHKETI